MDINGLIALAFLILALVVIVFWLLNRRGGRAKIEGPFGFGVDMQSEHLDRATGATIEDSKAGHHITAEAEDGEARVVGSKSVSGDITARSLRSDREADPKG